MSTSKNQTAGRDKNGAQALGDRHGQVSEKGVERTGKESRRRAGPDGPDARVVGDTFKR